MFCKCGEKTLFRDLEKLCVIRISIRLNQNCEQFLPKLNTSHKLNNTQGNPQHLGKPTPRSQTSELPRGITWTDTFNQALV